MYDELFALIDGDEYLSAHRGLVVERNGARTPWSDQIDLRLAQEMPLGGTQHLEVFAELFNFLNLVNPALGVVRTVPYQIMPLLRLYDIDPIGRPRFQWRPRNDPLVPESIASRWRLRLGIRYVL